MTIDITSKEALTELAQQLAHEMHGHEVLALYGQLGAGKTTFTQLLVHELGGTTEVTSPTFTIHHQYTLNEEQTIHHFDLYRVKNTEELRHLGLPEILFANQDIIIIEWPELIKDQLPSNTRHLHFSLHGNTRTVHIESDSQQLTSRQSIISSTRFPDPRQHDCLYIDSSQNTQLYLAINEQEKVIQYDSPRDQDTLKEIVTFLEEQKLSLQDLTSLQVHQGPGSFTSLRTGIAAAQALAFALQIPINNQQSGTSIEAKYGSEPNINKS